MIERPVIQLVWLKRDLRLHDHTPLSEAARTGLPTLVCYWFEPSLLQSPESDVRHWRFVYESLEDMRLKLSAYHIPLYVWQGEVLPALELLQQHFTIRYLWSHQETGVKITFDRDVAVQHFCKKKGIEWRESAQDGIVRGAKNRIGWQEHFTKTLREPLREVPLAQIKGWPLPASLQQALRGPELPAAFRQRHPNFQPGGESVGRRYMQSFFAERAQDYSRHLSKPLLSRRSCSRLSPYFAWGCLSVREVYQTAETQRANPDQAFSMRNFQSRLWWRSHYMQKLESLWQLEFEPINPGLQVLDRTTDERFEAWATGRTGFPMVDASMRCLEATGWLNFRMRAMLATFVTFTLWQDWRPAAQHLARLFLDYEPGIHFAQWQMQAGLTGYHPMRIFNPIVQSQRHDTDGAFVRQWVPELQAIPAPQIYTPWQMTRMEQSFYNCRIGEDYPLPIVDYEAATRAAKARYWEFRQLPTVQAELPRVWERLCIPTDVAKYRAHQPSDAFIEPED